jgi:hypothetical protein
MFLRIVLPLIMNVIIQVKWSWKKRSFMYCGGITLKKKTTGMQNEQEVESLWL